MKKTFEINYKLRYAETEDRGQEYLKAADKKQALKIFAKRMKISTKQFSRFEDWCWKEGVWMASFKNIKQVKEKQCRHCCGKGIVYV
jgi:predicted methyltransferase